MIDPNRPALHARSKLHAEQRPDHPAILFEGRATTYGQLHRASNRTAHALRAAVISTRSSEMTAIER